MPHLFFDKNLRDIPVDLVALKQEVQKLHDFLPCITDPKTRVSTLGQIGVYLRRLEDLDAAESTLNEALKIISENNLGQALAVQQKIRLGHVLQWKKQFDKSNPLFLKVISECRENLELTQYLDFALQHSGKNLFDQKRFQEALTQFNEALILRQNRKAPLDQVESTELAIKETKKHL